MQSRDSKLISRVWTWFWQESATVLIVVLVIAAFVVGYMIRGAPETSGSGSATTQPLVHDHGQSNEAQVWACSMHPEIRKPNPGKCPICGMDLVPATTGGAGPMAGMRQMAVTPEAAKLMEIETSPVERRYVDTVIRMVGKVEYDETQLGYITAWVGGRLDRLFVDYTGVAVNKGDHMVELYSPELLSAQEELIQAIRAVDELSRSGVGIVRETAQATVIASREKLRLWGLTPEQINQVESRGTPSDHVTIQSPMGGIVIHKNAQEGMYVQTGTRIYTIADLTRLWVILDAYESDLAWLRYGQPVRFTTEAFPGEQFTGTIAFIDPVLDEKRRTIKVRVNVKNDDGRLKPGMFVRGMVRARVAGGGRVIDKALAGKWIGPMHPEIVKDTPGTCDICGMKLVRAEQLGYIAQQEDNTAKPLVVPASAVLNTGRRAVVYVKVPGADRPTFEGREIVLGPRAGDYYIVLSNLQEGDQVVTQGNFKIDSALQIIAKPSMMNPIGGGSGGGHRHGNSTPLRKDAAPSETSQGSNSVPDSTLKRWHQMEAAYHKLSTAVETQDLPLIRSQYAAIGQALKNFDHHELTGASHSMWIELSMRIINDTVEGNRATTLEDARRNLRSLGQNMKQVRQHFGLEQPSSHFGGHGHE